jgi:hypothetical protein
VHIGDRESDIYELYCLAEELGTGFLVRSCVDRLAEDGDTTISKVMAQIQSSGTHEVRFRDAQNHDGPPADRQAAEISAPNPSDHPCRGDGSAGRARSRLLEADHEPAGGKPCPVESHAQAVHKLEWYALRWKIETFFRTLKVGCRIELRWKIETFFRTLKVGCRIEDIRLATADRLANCIALCCIVADPAWSRHAKHIPSRCLNPGRARYA